MMSLSSCSLKGSGWYATDYAGKKPQPAKHKEESSPAETSPAAADSSAAAGGKED
jgi:predicted nucleic acid-binding Zn ribbon protein